MANLELVNIDLSMRCAYCDDCSHLTVECPGLRSSSPIAREFREKHFPEPRCYKCDAPEWAGRKMFARRMVNRHGETETLLTCGDCLKNGTPLAAQPVRESEPINYHAWQTPCDEGVGGL